MPSVSMNTQAAAQSGLYVPVHKRSSSRSDASSTGSVSPRSASPTSQHESSIESPRLPIYSIQDILLLSKSPLVVFSPDHREHLKDTIPEIVLSRKQRKAIEHKQHAKAHASADEMRSTEGDRKPLSPSPMWNSQPAAQRRTTGRLPERRRNTKKVVDELSWRVPRTRSISAGGSPLLFVPSTA